MNALLPTSAITLEPLLPAQVEAIASQTTQALAGLLASDAVSGNTARCYAGALRYWDAWHHAAFGTVLPLLRQPRCAVETDAILAFIAHHTPEDGGQRSAMPEAVARRLAQIRVRGGRRTCERTEGMDGTLLSLATLRNRLAALSSCHQLAGLVPDWRDAPAYRRVMRALGNRIARSARVLQSHPKRALTREDVDAMVQACAGDGLRGLRDAALLLVAFHTARRRSELAAMRWADLTPWTDRRPDATGYRWIIPAAKGKATHRADEAAAEALILGPVARALMRWRTAANGMPVPPDALGACWLRVGRDGRTGAPMDAAQIAQAIKHRAAQIGLDPATVGAHSLRSGAATTFLEEGGALADASDLLGHARMETTRRFYDRRKVNERAARRMLLGETQP